METTTPEEYRQSQESRTISRAIIVALGAMFFGYAVLRALRVSLTIDEAITFNEYVSRGFGGLFRIDTANNHILNTLLTWLTTRIAGTGVFALRLPNLASHILYLVFSVRLLDRYLRGAAAVAGFVVLNANPYVLEFFSLSRGYGISLGLLMASLYYLFRFMDELRSGEPLASRTLAKALWTAGAAVLADMALLFVFLAIAVLAFVIIAIQSRAVRRTPRAVEPPLRTRRHPLLAAGLGVLILLINGSNLLRWKGDGPYLVRLGERVLIVVLLFGLLGLALRAAGRLGARLHLIAPGLSRVLLGGIWILAAFVAVPIYFLHSGEELYWGGKIGFFHDTLLGLIQDVLYGHSYMSGQEYVVFGLLAGVVILFLVAALINRPIRRFTSSGPAFALLALILATWGFFMGERPFFGLPYLLGRTAIFFVPLAALSFIFALNSFQAHPRLRPAVIGILAAAAMIVVVHFTLSANTSFASEWMPDADNKAVISDLLALRDKIGSPDRTVALAVRWQSYPALRYYVRQERLSWLKLGIIPGTEGCDAYYLDEAFDPRRMVLLKSYPLSGHILVTPQQ